MLCMVSYVVFLFLSYFVYVIDFFFTSLVGLYIYILKRTHSYRWVKKSSVINIIIIIIIIIIIAWYKSM
jgi:hypothetical protein